MCVYICTDTYIYMEIEDLQKRLRVYICTHTHVIPLGCYNVEKAGNAVLQLGFGAQGLGLRSVILGHQELEKPTA